ncbi:hypothetical protein G6L37_01905 [Agrobacterium rubi]|nr:hypothetical protein [Agrobacterium rubi]NTF24147.1 hypothetical protein [Agrobacterium rubi]
MIYDAFNSMTDTVGSLWDESGSTTTHAAFVAGIAFWFVAERVIGFIATPIIKAASIAVVLLLTFLGISALESFATYSDGGRPAVTIEESNRQILKDALQ